MRTFLLIIERPAEYRRRRRIKDGGRRVVRIGIKGDAAGHPPPVVQVSGVPVFILIALSLMPAREIAEVFGRILFTEVPVRMLQVVVAGIPEIGLSVFFGKRERREQSKKNYYCRPRRYCFHTVYLRLRA